MNLEADDQTDRQSHGGPDKAVYAPRRFTKAGLPGAYLRMTVEGDVGSGDEIRVVERPNHNLTIGDVFRIYARDREEAGRLLTVPHLSPSWQQWAEQWLEEHENRRADTAARGCW